MALTVRTNGSTAANIITASWFNDFYNIFTGAMQDQPITFKCNQLNKAIGAAPSIAPTAVASAGSALGIGVYRYTVTFVSADGGESTAASPQSSVTTTTGNRNVSLSNILVGPTGTVKRNIYRSKVGLTTLFFAFSVNNNTATTATDSTADASLGANGYPLASTFGGTITLQDENASNNLVLNNNGDIVMFGTLRMYPSGSPTGSGVSAIEVSTNGGWGVRRFDGVRLCEARNDGRFTIGGSAYTTTGTYGTAGSVAFDSFDVGEVYKCDKSYPNGTVVCPAEGDVMKQCEHDNCAFASILSRDPGLGMGTPDNENGVHYVALVGRVLVRTALDLPIRTMVVSDGRGGIRAQQKGEAGFSLGVIISPARQDPNDNHWKVGIMIRPMFCVLK